MAQGYLYACNFLNHLNHNPDQRLVELRETYVPMIESDPNHFAEMIGLKGKKGEYFLTVIHEASEIYRNNLQELRDIKWRDQEHKLYREILDHYLPPTLLRSIR